MQKLRDLSPIKNLRQSLRLVDSIVAGVLCCPSWGQLGVKVNIRTEIALRCPATSVCPLQSIKRKYRLLTFLPRFFIIVISRLLKRYLKAKHTRAPAYSQALRRIKGDFSKGVKRSSGPISRIPGRDRVAVKMGVIQVGRVNDQMGQGRSVWRDDILILSGRPGGRWQIHVGDVTSIRDHRGKCDVWPMTFARVLYWKPTSQLLLKGLGVNHQNI